MSIKAGKLSANDINELNCVKRFLPLFNKENSTNFSIVNKNQKQDEVDVFVHDNNNNILKLQITKAYYLDSYVFKKNTSDRTKNKTKEFDSLFRDVHDIEPCLQSIKSKIDLYKNRNIKIDDIILLLDDVHTYKKYCFEKRFLEKGYSNLNKYFKEVWYVGEKDNIAYKIF